MPKCPNCGLETLRTEDWACQWCGYPLISSSYKKIPKTYNQLKQKSLNDSKSELEVEPVPVPVPEPAQQVEPVPVPVPEPAQQVEPVPVPVPEPAQQVEPVPVPVPEPAQQVQPVPEQKTEPAIELTVDELLSAYATEESAADAKLGNKLVRVTGVVAMIDVKEMLDTHYIRLTTAERDLLRSVRCIFDKEQAPVLQELSLGKTVKVQGIYNGSIIEIRMIDCVLV
jgi:hypothetical protein